MEMRALGAGGPAVSALGLGCMGMSEWYGAADDAESIATIHEAMDRGVTLLDTADFYGTGHNEELIRTALRGRRREDVRISLKFGALRTPGSLAVIGVDGRPESVRNFLAYSLRRLGTDHVDVYMPSRVDPRVPIEETVGAIADLVREGYVRHLGLSEASAETVRRAHAVHPVAAVQTELSLWTREPEDDLLPTLRALGISLVAYGALSRGLLAGAPPALDPATDLRAHLPRFQGENLARNRASAEALAGLAREKGCTPAQLALAWVMARGPEVITLAGTRRRERLRENLGAADLTLTAADLARLEAAFPRGAAAGERYMPAAMALVGR